MLTSVSFPKMLGTSGAPLSRTANAPQSCPCQAPACPQPGKALNPPISAGTASMLSKCFADLVQETKHQHFSQSQMWLPVRCGTAVTQNKLGEKRLLQPTRCPLSFLSNSASTTSSMTWPTGDLNTSLRSTGPAGIPPTSCQPFSAHAGCSLTPQGTLPPAGTPQPWSGQCMAPWGRAHQ